MGMTFANFILFGKTPVFIIWFIIRVRGLMIDGGIHLSKMVDIPSIPTLLLFVNNFSTTGRNCGTPLRDACVRQACLPAIATSSFKIFLTQSFPRRGATCYILPWRAMSRLFNGVNFGYRSADVYRSFQTYLGVLATSDTSTMAN